MKVFIGESKILSDIDTSVKEMLNDYMKKNYEILIGDCFGADALVQEFLTENDYKNVIVYVSGDKVRNNTGNFEVCTIKADGTKGFDFYRQKDIAMAKNADCGFMIWDGKSKGTLCNIIDLVYQNKKVTVFLNDIKTIEEINKKDDILSLIQKCDISV